MYLISDLSFLITFCQPLSAFVLVFPSFLGLSVSSVVSCSFLCFVLDKLSDIWDLGGQVLFQSSFLFCCFVLPLGCFLFFLCLPGQVPHFE